MPRRLRQQTQHVRPKTQHRKPPKTKRRPLATSPPPTNDAANSNLCIPLHLRFSTRRQYHEASAQVKVKVKGVISHLPHARSFYILTTTTAGEHQAQPPNFSPFCPPLQGRHTIAALPMPQYQRGCKYPHPARPRMIPPSGIFYRLQCDRTLNENPPSPTALSSVHERAFKSVEQHRVAPHSSRPQPPDSTPCTTTIQHAQHK